MSFGGALLAMSAVKSISQIGQGFAQKEEANFNATLLDGKGKLIDVQKDIENAQFERLKGRTMSKSIANIGASGIRLSGSALAVMLDTQKQINIDQAIGQFNLEQSKQFNDAEANQIRRQGKQAGSTGFSNAFSTILSGASTYAIYKGSK